MKIKLKLIVFPAILAAIAACGGVSDNRPAGGSNAGNSNAANTNTAPRSAAPAKDELVAIEKKAWEDWATRRVEGLEGYMATRFVNVGSNGPSDRAAAIKSWTGHKCDMRDLSFSDENLTEIADGISLLTFKATAAITCEGITGPSPLNVSVIYAREGEKWKAMYYQEVPAADARGEYAPPSSSANPAEELATLQPVPEDIAVIEKRLWEAWKAQDRKTFEEHVSARFIGNGRTGRVDRAAYLQGAFGSECKIDSYTTGTMKAMEIGKDTTMIIYRASQKGKCGAEAVPENVMSVSIYKRENGKPMVMYYMESPLRQKA